MWQQTLHLQISHCQIYAYRYKNTELPWIWNAIVDSRRLQSMASLLKQAIFAKSIHKAALLQVGSAIFTSPWPRVSPNCSRSIIEMIASGRQGILELIVLSSHLNNTICSATTTTHDKMGSKYVLHNSVSLMVAASLMELLGNFWILKWRWE